MATLTLSVLRCPDSVAAEQRQVQGGELTLGRGGECGWSLADPLKSLSRKHCTLEFYAGAWQVRDLSVNGTFLNFSTAPIGRDSTQPLHDGDRLRLGDYEIEAHIEEPSYSVSSAMALDPAPSPFGDARRPDFGAARLPGLDEPELIQQRAVPDHSSSGSDAYIPPPVLSAGKPIIPDDWYKVSDNSPTLTTPPPPPPPPPAVTPPADERFSGVTPRPAAVQPGQPAPAVSPANLPVPGPAPERGAQAPAASAAGDGMRAGLATLMAGGDLSPDMVVRAAADPQAALRNAGVLLRAAVSGIRALLIARGTVKREFRIEQTMLRQTDNNPLKFAASDEHALASLLDPRTSALRAIEESIGDLTLHQVATLAATQAAARALLERLGPSLIEADDTGGGLMPGAREKRLWEAYKRRHALLLAQFEDDFESAFGTAFARAYEQAAGRDKA